jgi:hypothetical protein
LKRVKVKTTSTTNGQNVNEQKGLCHLLPILIQLLKGCLHKRLQQGMDKTSMNKNACHFLPILIQLLKVQTILSRNGQNVNKQKCSRHLLPSLIQLPKGCLHKRLQKGLGKMSMNKNAYVTFSKSLFSLYGGVYTSDFNKNEQNVNEQKCLSLSPNPYSASKGADNINKKWTKHK